MPLLISRHQGQLLVIMKLYLKQNSFEKLLELAFMQRLDKPTSELEVHFQAHVIAVASHEPYLPERCGANGPDC